MTMNGESSEAIEERMWDELEATAPTEVARRFARALRSSPRKPGGATDQDKAKALGILYEAEKTASPKFGRLIALIRARVGAG